jgi:hypothetical protein
MIDSLHRVIVIARNTLTEAIRQKVLTVLLLFGLVLICTSVFFSQLVIDQQIKFVKDFGCGAIGLIGFALAVLSTAQLLPQELHNRTIYTILAKPVRRAEFLLGKFFGVVLLLSLSVALMSLAFAGTLAWQEAKGLESTRALYDRMPHWENSPDVVSEYQHDVASIQTQTRDPQLIEAILLIFAKLVMTAAIALLISTFSTSFIFTVVTTTMLYLVGHLESVARDVWLQRGAEAGAWQSGFVGLISLLVPDLNSFTIVDEILAGNRVPWGHTFNLLGYAGIYIIVLLAVSELIFRNREI